MKTLIVLFMIWGVVSSIRIYKVYKEKKIYFNLFTLSLFDWMGFLFGITISFMVILYLTITYLP